MENPGFEGVITINKERLRLMVAFELQMAGETVGQNPLGVGPMLNYFHFAIFTEETERRGEHRTGRGR